MGVAGNEGATRANPEPEPSLEVTHPCWLEPGLPLTAPMHLYPHVLPPCCRHSRPLINKNLCTYTVHSSMSATARVMMEEVMVTSHPNFPILKQQELGTPQVTLQVGEGSCV